MNIELKKWKKFKNKNIIYKMNGEKIYLENPTFDHGYIIKTKIFKAKNNFLEVFFKGEVIKGNSATLCVFNLKRKLLAEITLNGKSLISILPGKKYVFAIKISANSVVEVEEITMKFSKSEEKFLEQFGQQDTLILTPSYPSLENKYFGGFVHSRLKAYHDAGIRFDVACCYFYDNMTKYQFEGIDVLKLSFFDLRKILQTKKYKRILIHFFDEKYAQILDATDLSETQLFIWVHGPETLYWDWPNFTTCYFHPKAPITLDQKKYFEMNDLMIKRYNQRSNVTWIFVSNWIKEKSEELIQIKFNNYCVIPNVIDEKNFNYIPKTVDQRKKVFFLRRFDNIDKYAIDVNVRTILELSRRKFFNDMEFHIYGTGDFYKELIDPIKNFPNVHFYTEFLTHSDIAKIHKENGIALFATRYDSQGVSMCEAAMSGLVVISSQNDAVAEFIPNDVGLLAPTEDYVEYANIIEQLYYDEKLFLKLSELCHNKVYDLCSFEHTTKKEIDLFSKPIMEKSNVKKIKQSENVILSIIIPSYNVSQYLEHTVSSIVNQKKANQLEILIVNDGSKDNTPEVARKIISKFCDSKKPIIHLIDKENGGHGSTINVGISKATGKYIRVIDGDDWVNSEQLERLIEQLENENSDIVITDYCEDLAPTNSLIPKKLYSFMKVGKQYQFDDVCNRYYGFQEWGPILATANFKTEMLQQQSFKLTEKCFYVDMEFDIYTILNAKTITYYDYDIYRYFIGRTGQSVSKESFIKNRFQHEKVLFNMLKILENNKVSDLKKDYICRILIVPMIKAHYLILTEYLTSRTEFWQFDQKLRKKTPLYYDPLVATRFIKFYRGTHGFMLKLSPFFKNINNIKRNRRK